MRRKGKRFKKKVKTLAMFWYSPTFGLSKFSKFGIRRNQSRRAWQLTIYLPLLVLGFKKGCTGAAVEREGSTMATTSLIFVLWGIIKTKGKFR